MSKIPRKHTGLWQHLKKSGLLDHGSDKEIEKEKRKYKKEYQKKYRQNRRKEYPVVMVSVDIRTYKTYERKAKKRHQSVGAYILDAAKAYHKKTYLVPDPGTVAVFEQRLRLIYTDIKMMAKHLKKLSLPDLHASYQSLAEKISYLEEYVSDTLRHPPRI